MKYLILAASLLLLLVMNQNINDKRQITISLTGEIEFENSDNGMNIEFQNNNVHNVTNTLPCIPAINSPCKQPCIRTGVDQRDIYSNYKDKSNSIKITKKIARP